MRTWILISGMLITQSIDPIVNKESAIFIFVWFLIGVVMDITEFIKKYI